MKNKLIIFGILVITNTLFADYRDFFIKDLKNINNNYEPIIVSTEEYFQDIEEYLEYRKNEYPNIGLVDIKDIQKEFSGDNAESLRSFIFYTKENWISKSLKNIMLVGWFDRISNLRLKEDNLVNDTLGKDAYLVLDTLNGIDTLIYNIGRLPARSSEDLKLLINKIKYFEANSYKNKFDAIFLYDSLDYEPFEYLGKQTAKNFDNDKVFHVSGNPKSSYFNDFSTWLNEVNFGTTFLLGYIHGNPCKWGYNNFLSCEKYMNTQFDNNPFIFLGASCSQRIQNPTTKELLELLLTKDRYGAVATLASEIDAFASIGGDILENFIKYSKYNPEGTIGSAWRFAINNCNCSNYKFNYTLLGDPLLKVKIISDLSEENITNNHIYPNPAKDYIIINLDSINPTLKRGVAGIGAGVEGASSIEIYDIMGIKIQTTPVETKNFSSLHRIDISNLSPGVYFVKIFSCNGDCFIVEKFVKY